MELNTKDNGKRKFILVQKPVLFDTKSEAYKAGYKDICSLGEERIKKVCMKIKSYAPNTNTGFKIYKVQ